MKVDPGCLRSWRPVVMKTDSFTQTCPEDPSVPSDVFKGITGSSDPLRWILDTYCKDGGQLIPRSSSMLPLCHWMSLEEDVSLPRPEHCFNLQT